MANLPHITRFGLPGIDRRPVQAHASLRAGASARGVQVFAAPQVRASETKLRPERMAISQEDANRDRSVGKNPMVIELVRRAQDAQVFLRMAAIELRRLAEEDPDIAAEVRRVAQELEVEAEDLTPRDAE